MKELKNRLRSLESTHKVTSAMKIVSATQFNKLKNKAAHTFEYLNGVANLSQYFKPLSECKFKKLFIVINADRGLCGGFNYALSKKVKDYLKKNPKVHVALFGNKVRIDPVTHKVVLKKTISDVQNWGQLRDIMSVYIKNYTSN